MRPKHWLSAGICLAACLAVAFALAAPADHVLGRYTTPLNGRSRSQRHNAHLALRRLVGAVIQPGEVFSFNARVGTFSRDQGYRKAPVSYNGQLIDSWGGGVCQTSTTLYNAALLAGMEIVERTRHNFAPGYVPPGRDAAVAFDAIDLKFKNPYSFPVRIEGGIEDDRLDLGIYGSEALKNRPIVYSQVRQVSNPDTFLIGDGDHFGRMRNSGKAGYDVVVYRKTGNKKEMISADTYPAMNRVIDMR